MRHTLFHGFVSICIGIFAFIEASHAQAPTDSARLRVIIEDIQHTEGQVLVGIYNQKEGAFSTQAAYRYQVRPARKGQMEFAFTLPRGTYAIGAYHDANMNAELDKNFIGIPKEDYGISNNLSLPDFDKAKLKIETDLEIRIRLH